MSARRRPPGTRRRSPASSAAPSGRSPPPRRSVASGWRSGSRSRPSLRRDVTGQRLPRRARWRTAQVIGAAHGRLPARRADVAGVAARIGLMTGYGIGRERRGRRDRPRRVAQLLPAAAAGRHPLRGDSASNLQSRYAATDLAEPRHRARALSIVLWATTIGAVAGPNLSRHAAGGLAVALGLPTLTGPFVVSSCRALPPSWWSRCCCAPTRCCWPARSPTPRARQAHRRMDFPAVLRTLREHPGVLAGVLALASAHPVMVAVMSMTPVHLATCPRLGRG